MKIDRIEDRKFQLTLTEKEADFIADQTEIDFHKSKLLASRIGSVLFHYMCESCMFPHAKRATLEMEL